MNVLVACEESQEVCKAFRERGHRAFSCDVQECSGGHPEWHIQGDVLPLLNGSCTFQTADTHTHTQNGPWDLLIAHPPCTFLSAAGAVRLFNADHTIKDADRLRKGYEAKAFFLMMLNSKAKKICVENPVPLSIFHLPPYSQIIEPYQFGDPWKKRTCLWLKGLPKLLPTNEVKPIGYWVGAHGHDKAKNGMSKGFRDPKKRSKTFPGIAKAMVQWGETGEETIIRKEQI